MFHQLQAQAIAIELWKGRNDESKEAKNAFHGIGIVGCLMA